MITCPACGEGIKEGCVHACNGKLIVETLLVENERLKKEVDGLKIALKTVIADRRVECPLWVMHRSCDGCQDNGKCDIQNKNSGIADYKALGVEEEK